MWLYSLSPSLRLELAQIGLAVFLPALLIAQPARADEEDTVNVIAGAGFQHDSNLFRRPSGESDRGDDITSTSLGIKLSKRYSLQRFELEAGLIDYRYKTFDYLNFTARNYAAAWRWSLTPYLYGNLSSDRKEALNSFSDYSNFSTRNVRTDKNQRFDGVLEASGSWRVLGGLAQTTRTNSELFNQEGDTRLNTAEAGLRYDFRSGSSLSYVTKNGRGEYLNRSQPIESTQLDNRFDQRENEIRLIWPITGKTTIDARAAHVERTHDHFGERDYAGNVGNLNVNWKITDKTSLMAGLARELSSYQSQDSSYIRSDRFTLSPLWQISEKTALRGRFDYARRDYRGAIAVTPVNDRADTLRSAMLALEWQPLRSLKLSASLQNEKRTSNLSQYDYKDTIAGVVAQFTY